MLILFLQACIILCFLGTYFLLEKYKKRPKPFSPDRYLKKVQTYRDHPEEVSIENYAAIEVRYEDAQQREEMLYRQISELEKKVKELQDIYDKQNKEIDKLDIVLKTMEKIPKSFADMERWFMARKIHNLPRVIPEPD